MTDRCCNGCDRNEGTEVMGPRLRRGRRGESQRVAPLAPRRAARSCAAVRSPSLDASGTRGARGALMSSPASIARHSRFRRLAQPRQFRRRLLHRADPRAVEQRKGDDGDFPQIDLVQPPHPALRIDLAAHGAVADRQPVDRAGFEQRQQFARAHHVGDQPAARLQPAPVLGEVEPDADRLGRIVLEQHRDLAQAALPSASA